MVGSPRYLNLSGSCPLRGLLTHVPHRTNQSVKRGVDHYQQRFRVRPCLTLSCDFLPSFLKSFKVTSQELLMNFLVVFRVIYALHLLLQLLAKD